MVDLVPGVASLYDERNFVNLSSPQTNQRMHRFVRPLLATQSVSTQRAKCGKGVPTA